MKYAKGVLIVMVSILTLTMFACSSNVELTENRARRLITEYSSRRPFAVPISELTQHLIRTTEDYTSPGESGYRREVVAKLIEKGYVVKQTQTLTYPKVTGHFVSEKDRNGWYDDYDFQTVSGTNNLSGSHLAYQAGYNPTFSITGRVEPDGRVEFHDTGYNSQSWSVRQGTYIEDGSVAHINLVAFAQYGISLPPSVLSGRASGQKTSVTWYEYALAPSMKSKVSSGAFGDAYAPGGVYKIGDVTNLRLLSTVEAIAQFQWQASLDDFGETMKRGGAPSGTGRVVFGKKPNGEWVINSVTY